ncbi:MAG TPA: Nif3-like dinuclear metal center hexameric protein [Bacillota bacterium]|nr:Nif3-like dinuclear metal center hexameric protein [Bacillota bacterium]
MWATVKTVAAYLDQLAPRHLALPGDPVGLQLGDPRREVRTLLVALELDQATLAEAAARKAELVVTHHPLLFQPLQALDESTPHGALVARAVRHEISVFSAHTNLDIAPRGLNHRLADLLGLMEQGRSVMETTGQDRLLKLVVFVPAGHEDSVRQALAEAGAGWIGAYSHCTFQVPGTGTFMPREGTDPYIGQQGRLEKVDEFRLETILPASLREAVLQALFAVHPYEEVAYDLYPLEREGTPYGLGLIGNLERPLTLEQILKLCREKLQLSTLRYWAPPREEYSRIAVCSGSGGSLVERAALLGAELYISGDFRYHDFKKAEAAGLCLVDAGHYGTERPVVELLGQYLRRCFKRDGYQTSVVEAGVSSAGWNYA